MAFLNQLSTVLVFGFIYAIVSFGVYITYKILDIADLSVDGTFPLGGVIFAMLLVKGCPWYIGMVCSLIAGCVAGFLTGLLHVKLKINALLSGIITMTALLSINYLIAGSSQIPFSTNVTLLNNKILKNVTPIVSNYLQVLFALIIVIVVKILLDLFLKTKTGFMLRATGDNPKMVTQMGKDTGNYIVLGLSLANGLVALAGSLYVQYNTVFNSSMGPGTVVIALACVIIGCVMVKRFKCLKDTTGVIIGGIIYYAALTISMNFLGSEYIKLTVAVLFIIILLLDSGSLGKWFKKLFSKNKSGGNINA